MAKALDLDAVEARARLASGKPVSRDPDASAEQRVFNAWFITAARQDVLDLVAEVRELRESNRQRTDSRMDVSGSTVSPDRLAEAIASGVKGYSSARLTEGPFTHHLHFSNGHNEELTEREYELLGAAAQHTKDQSRDGSSSDRSHPERALVALSEWIDAGNAHRDPEAVTWGRLAKITEEAGEVIAAYIGATGQNPRKGQTCDLRDVREELLDVAVTALGAYEHLAGHDGSALDDLTDKILRVADRAGLQQDGAP